MAANTTKTKMLFPDNAPTFSSGKLTSKIVIKSDYVRADGTSALYLQIFMNGGRKRINLDLYVPEIAFDKTKMRVKKAYKGSKDINLVIEKVLADVNQIEVMYRLTGNYLTVDLIEKELKSPSSRLDFLKYWEEQIEIDEKHLTPATIRSARSVLQKVKMYKPVWLFKDLSNEGFQDMLAFLKNTIGNSQNTLFNVTKYARKYLRRAERNGIRIPITYTDIPHAKVKAEIGHLSKQEIQRLWNFYNEEYVPDIYRSVLAKFLFSCLTGLRISDMLLLSEANFVGDFLIKFTSKKTKKVQKIKLNLTAKQIINDGFIFKDPIREQTINKKLKEIAKLVDIPYNLHYHMARHSFATNFLKQGGRVEVLQRLLAHSSIRDTMNYVHVVDEDINKEIYLLDNMFEDDEDDFKRADDYFTDEETDF